ncbi:MAG: hypothetical protein K2M72_00080 [Paramuribaculum sp.]|nr:hypothetical protein [Paramuribaculum sp.]
MTLSLLNGIEPAAQPLPRHVISDYEHTPQYDQRYGRVHPVCSQTAINYYDDSAFPRHHQQEKTERLDI